MLYSRKKNIPSNVHLQGGAQFPTGGIAREPQG